MKIQHKHKTRNTRNTRNTRKTHKNRKTRKCLRKNKTNRRKRGGNPLSRAIRRSQTNSRSTLRGKSTGLKNVVIQQDKLWLLVYKYRN